MKRAVCSILLVLILGTFFSLAAQPVEQPAPSNGADGRQSMRQMQGLTQNMDKMATTVARMAEICEEMMKREMALFPYKIAAGIILGVIVTLVLLLLLVLEVQWIIYWGRLLRERKRRS